MASTVVGDTHPDRPVFPSQPRCSSRVCVALSIHHEPLAPSSPSPTQTRSRRRSPYCSSHRTSIRDVHSHDHSTTSLDASPRTAMSTTAVRMTPSSSFVPRSSSRPSSPSLPPPPAHLPLPPNRNTSYNNGHHRSASVPGSPAFAPRMQDMERRGSSHLRNEVTDNKNKVETMSPGARAILKVSYVGTTP